MIVWTEAMHQKGLPMPWRALNPFADLKSPWPVAAVLVLGLTG